MRIAIFISGHVRTLFYKFHENISLIKRKIPDCKVDVFYSFWDDPSEVGELMIPGVIIADDYVQQVINHDNIICYFRKCGGNNVSGEIQSVEVMKEVLKNSLLSRR